MQWDQDTEKIFNAMIERVPVFMRPIAKDKVLKKAQQIAQAANRLVMNEKDMVDAFFDQTPFGFHGPMKSDMDDLGIDYVKYGYK